ncbi:MAG TPA: aminopeptidase, partial [Candidatus Cloacimonadota bacterium]|nr:aminopeptidase [Candidatus Cloacimonadota bacterium]
MIKNLQLITKHSQIKELGNELKYKMLIELIRGSATCQQLASIFDTSKQKIHYNLLKLMEENLFEVADDVGKNGKEVYYRATAKNYVLDFSVGEHLGNSLINSRGVISNILEGEYHLNLAHIAAKILKDSLKLKSRQRLMIVTGRYNLPLVEQIIKEAGRMNIRTTLLYQDTDMLKARNEEYSLAAFNADYQHFNRLLKQQDVYLNLNGESRHLLLEDKEKQKLRQYHFSKSHQIIQEKGIRIAVMPGLLNNTLNEHVIESELQFWKALDIDYAGLRDSTHKMCEELEDREYLILGSGETGSLKFQFGRLWAECGSFGCGKYQSPVINYPGGEILMVPKPFSMNGIIEGDIAYAFGEKIIKPRLIIENNEIKNFSAEDNERLLAKAIATGGIDG